MRELKFRAWHTEKRRMFEVYGLGIDFVTENTFDGVDPGTNAFCGDDMNFIEIMQFIGIKDVEGADTYEGDIVGDGHSKGIVFFNKDEAKFQVDFSPYDECPQDLSSGVNCWHIILGNIYENPDLV